MFIKSINNNYEMDIEVTRVVYVIIPFFFMTNEEAK